MAEEWDAPAPHLIRIDVTAADIDAYQHVNNAVYLSWLDRVAWSHSAALGVPLEECLRMQRGMAAHRTEIDYLRALVLGDQVEVGTWIVASDRRLRVQRRFQIRRLRDGLTVARARIAYVCINLQTGRAARMPERFMSAYVVTQDLAGASAAKQVDHRQQDDGAQQGNS